MRFLAICLAVFLTGCAGIDTKESGSALSEQICDEMIGTWFTDTTVINSEYGKKRDLVRIDRKPDGTAYLKGISIYYDSNEFNDWEFPSQWSCDGDWYAEKNEWGETYFKVSSFEIDKTVLFDAKNNLGAPEPVEIYELHTLSSHLDLPIASQISTFLGLK